jgi:single-stranded-DNA-specific exonuclease
LRHSRWNLLPPAPHEHLAGEAGVTPLLAQLLFNRGIKEPGETALFFEADHRLCGDPWRLPDMQQATTRIFRAMFAGEQIAVYGDFDTDGITATAILVEGLSRLGGRVTPYIPHRLTEGYGLHSSTLEKLHHEGISLVISVDCGVTAVKEVRRAGRLGLDIIITDHHTPPDELPPAVAVVDPKRADSTYSFNELTGAGVALKLLQALFQGVGREDETDDLTDLAALGTVADLAPLIGENRYLVKKGLEQINHAPRLGLRQMAAGTRLEIGSLNTDSISWTIAPRLNAAGRLAHAMTSYRLLTTDSPEEARELSAWLDGKNRERQQLTERACARAREQVLERELTPLLLVTDHDIAPGIAGLVAGRLTEEFYRPSVVVKVGEKVSGGSCRSIEEFNIIRALNRFEPLFTHFGGHAQAAGFTLPTSRLPELAEGLQSLAAAELDGVELRPRLDVEAAVKLDELNGNTYDQLQKLAPFGRGNPLPVFLSSSVRVLNCRPMGNDGGHLRLRLRQGNTGWDAVAFRCGDAIDEITPKIDIVYNLELDRWNGNERLRLNLLDFAPSGGSS